MKQTMMEKLDYFYDGSYRFIYGHFGALLINLSHGYRRGQSPIIVYSMPKVGSTSMQTSLLKHRIWSYQVHQIQDVSVYPYKIKYPVDMKFYRRWIRAWRLQHRYWTAKGLDEKFIKPKRFTKIITLVRDPITRNMSKFFDDPWRLVDGQDVGTLSQDKLIDLFLNKHNHQGVFKWFDREFKAGLGIDVYQYPFPYEQGYQRIKQDCFDVLVLRVELDDALKEKAIADFLDIPTFNLTRKYEGETRVHGPRYREFKEKIRLPQSYLDMMCDAKYTRHFYSSDEIEQMRQRWSRD